MLRHLFINNKVNFASGVGGIKWGVGTLASCCLSQETFEELELVYSQSTRKTVTAERSVDK